MKFKTNNVCFCLNREVLLTGSPVSQEALVTRSQHTRKFKHTFRSIIAKRYKGLFNGWRKILEGGTIFRCIYMQTFRRREVVRVQQRSS